MTSFFSTIKTYARTHKIMSTAGGIVIILVGYWGYGKLASTGTASSYIMAVVHKGTIVTSVTGSGQVSVSNQVDIKPKVSAEITHINVKAGDVVKAGYALMTMDSTNARIAVTNAEQALVTSRLQYQKDEAQSPITYQQNLDSLAVAKEDLQTTFNDTFNTLSNTYLDLPTVITGTQNILYGYDLNPSASQWNVDVISNLFNNDETSRQKIVAFAESAKKFWCDLDLKKWAEDVGGSSAEAIQAAIYFGLSLAIGYLFKKYFKLVFVCLLVSAFLIKALEFAQLLTINWDAIKSVLGITSSSDFNTSLNAWFGWIRGNLLLFISSVVGFLVGYKLG